MFPEAKESLFIIKSSSDSRTIPKPLDQGVMNLIIWSAFIWLEKDSSDEVTF